MTTSISPAPRVTGDDLRRSMRCVMLAWVFGAAWLYMTTGATLTRFAQLTHMPKMGFGILAALPFAGALMQLPMSYIVERYGNRKKLFISFGVVHRALWSVIALVPWLLPASWQWRGLVTVIALSWAIGQMGTPIWVSWMADVVPSRVRGRYFSRRSQLGQFVGVCVTIGIGYLLDIAERSGELTLLKTLSLTLGVAGIIGTFDYLSFLPVTDCVTVTPDRTVSLFELIRQPLRDANFRRFTAFTMLLTFALGYVGQFAWLFVFDVAGMSNVQANTMLVTGPLIATMIAAPFWGRMLDRLGRKPVLIVSGLLIIPGAAAWIFVSREHWVAGYAVAMLCTLAWPGVELTNFNILLNLSGPDRDRRYGSACVAVNSALVAIAGILSGLFGGVVAEALGDWRRDCFGWPLTYHGVLFIISGIIRGVALLCLINLKDEGATTTRAAFRYLGSNLYSNVQQVMFIPGRLLWQVGRWTYKLTPRPKK